MQSMPPGDLVCLELVGCGGFGLVYRGWSRTLGTEIALKMIQGEKGDGLRDFMKERDMMHKANYTYVLRLLGVYEKQDGEQIEYGLVMEYMHNGSLRTLFDRIANVPWALRFQILHQVVLGMNYLHHVLTPPIIHRDLKPRNVLLNKSLDVQITDFGLAKNAGSTTTSLNQATGTVSYMPPESFRNINYKPNKQFDVYSFAILMWSVLTGQEPYEVADSDMIMKLIPNGSRPDLDLVTKWTSVKMVSEAVDLMTECWNEEAENRPSFSDCKPKTLSMSRAFARDLDQAVQEVLDQLRRFPSSRRTSRPEDVPDGTDLSHMSSVADIRSYFTIQVYTEVLSESEANPQVGPPDDPVDPEEFLRSNFSAIVRGNPDISSILDDLYTRRILSQEEFGSIEASGTEQQQARAALHNIMNKGRASCTVFVHLLRLYSPSLMQTLVS